MGVLMALFSACNTVVVSTMRTSDVTIDALVAVVVIQVTIEELDIICQIPHHVVVSAQHGWNIDEVREAA